MDYPGLLADTGLLFIGFMNTLLLLGLRRKDLSSIAPLSERVTALETRMTTVEQQLESVVEIKKIIRELTTLLNSALQESTLRQAQLEALIIDEGEKQREQIASMVAAILRHLKKE